MVLARSLNPIPSRTRPLNSSAPMVLWLKPWESRSLPDLPRTKQFLFTCHDQTKRRFLREAAFLFCGSILQPCDLSRAIDAARPGTVPSQLPSQTSRRQQIPAYQNRRFALAHFSIVRSAGRHYEASQVASWKIAALPRNWAPRPGQPCPRRAAGSQNSLSPFAKQAIS